MTDEKKNAFTKDTIFSVTPAHLSKVNKITQAPPPITPVGDGEYNTFHAIADSIQRPLGPIVPITGIELMERWSIEATTLILLSYEGMLFPSFPADFRNDASWLMCQDSTTQNNYLTKCIYDKDVIEVAEIVYSEHLAKVRKKDSPQEDKELTLTPTQAPKALTPQAENYFKRNGEYWTIRFQGKESNPIKGVNGLRYIAYLLQSPRTSIHSIDLYNVVTGNTPDKTIDESEAIADGLNVGNKKQAKNDYKTKTEYLKKIEELEDIRNDYLKDAKTSPYDAETIMINIENLDIMKKELQKQLNTRNFPDDATKKQSLINGLLKTAYRKIKADKNIKECAVHLEKQIKPDGANGFIYTGEIKWGIFL